MAETDRRFMTGEHWRQSLGTVLMVTLMGSASLVGATLWIVSAIHAVAEANLSAMNAQAAIFARGLADQAVVFTKALGDLDHRVTILESQEVDAARATDRLSVEAEQLRSTEGDLTMALQRLNDLLPGRLERKR